jgi:Cu2+-exporting ATPase
MATTSRALPTTADCAHCGAPVPAGRIAGSASFCCAGCETVHDALLAGGLADWYRLAGDDRRAARTTDRSYQELDDPAFHAAHVRHRDDGQAEVSLYLEELRCTACVWLVERLPAIAPGVAEVRLDLGRGRADVVFDPDAIGLSAIARRLDRLGHPVHPYRGLDRDAQRRREDRALLIKIGVAGAAAGNIMLLAVALYAGEVADMTAAETTYFRWASLLVALPALAFAALPFFRGALAALTARRLHLDLPIAIGIVAGLVWGTGNVVRGVGEIYFDSLGMLVFLLLSARWLQARQHRRAASSAELLLALTPSVARRVEGDRVAEVPIDAVVAGDVLEVRAGDTIPVDGSIVAGRSALDAGLLTGESRPVDVAAGDAVHAGTVNLVAALQIRATATGAETRLGQLAARIDELSSARPAIQRLVDAVAGRFVAVVLVVAALTVAVWSWIDPVHAVEHAMALLVVTCPCALALATPLTMGLAIGRAARRGILVKGGDALERLSKVGTLVLDKTGTVTEGQVALASWHGEAGARHLAVALERHSAHPLARALVAADAAPAAVAVASDVREDTGRGISGRVDGIPVAIGSAAWIATRAEVPAAIGAVVDDAAARGETPVVIAIRGVAVAVAGFADRVRADAPAAVGALIAAGWRVQLLSGDDPRVVARVGAALGLPAGACRGGASPEDKLSAITALAARGPCVMVGDGVNDAAALAAATCGVAVSGSAEASIEAADVLVRAPGLAPLVALTDGARGVMTTIRRCLRASLAYNLLGGTLAVTGVIHPLVAALMMPISSLTILALASRSRSFRSPS